METFLKQVAHDLFSKLNGDFSNVAVVFPNKRAGLFFNEYLSAETEHPIWSPTYISISELFRKSSQLIVGDSIKLVCDLYKVFKEISGSNESLDDFYFWGEMLISDFDDADKNMVNTDMLFSNLKDLNDLIDNYEYLEEEQKEALSQFFSNFNIKESTQLKQRFITTWDILGKVYVNYKSLLKSQNLAYEGMMYRQVIENLDTDRLPYSKYIFIGFNVLNKVEHTLFEKLNAAGKALFYWDYDNYYLNRHPHEAGEFIRRNLKDFPSELPEVLFNNLDTSKEVSIIKSPTENGQVRFLPQWIRENLTPSEKETAVVLCNETLLQPVLHCIPENVKHINITMGFPLSQTPAYSFIHALIDLHTSGYNSKTGRYQYEQVVSILKHPYAIQLSDKVPELMQTLTANNRFFPLPSELMQDEMTRLIFYPCNTNKALCKTLSEILKRIAIIYKQQNSSTRQTYEQLYQESLFKAYTLVNRFYTLIEDGTLDVQPSTFQRLFTRIMATSNIPFHGEPAIGMQIMGVLETRNLDFRHLVLLSVNEGQLPQSGSDSSFIPYNIRKAFGMTTIDHKIAVYAYYFYRMIQRAEKVDFIYNTTTDGLNKGEISRFILQLLTEWNHPIIQKSLKAEQSPLQTEPIAINKDINIMRRMQSSFDVRRNEKASISPSALNCYLDCPLKFYYKYVAKLNIPDEVSSEIDSAKFGSIFHWTAEHIYKTLTEHSKLINKETLEAILKNEAQLHDFVDNGFKELFFNIPTNEHPEYNGIQLINSEVIFRYVRQLLQNDLRHTPFYFIASELGAYEDIEINTPKGIIKSRIGGIIDRMDEQGGTLRIVDYKTGGKSETFPSIESLFTPGEKRSNYIFQTFLYASIISKKLRNKNDNRKVSPALLYIHRAASEDYSPVIELKEPRKAPQRIDDFSLYESEYRELLQRLLEEIFNPDIPFRQTELEDQCSYCDFCKLCRKQ